MAGSAFRLRYCRIALACSGLVLGGALEAQVSVETAFTDTLVPSERSTTGLSKLTDSHVRELNRQITRELALARQGDVKGFSSSFTERRTEAQRKSAGLDLLTAGERAALDAVIGRTMARPTLPGTVARVTSVDSIETVRIKPEIHGEVSVMYGMASGGRSSYGGSMAMTYEDPTSGVTASFRYTQMRGDLWMLDDPYHNRGYGRGYYGHGRSLPGLCR